MLMTVLINFELLKCFFTLLIMYPIVVNSRKVERSFVISYDDNCFMKDNQPFRYISGGMHYFRIPSIYWRDRLSKAKALGINTIQTYIPWNIHEIIEGEYDFSGEKDLLAFINIAEELNLLVILRPGPYIDAEWEFGGLPWWLAKYPAIEMRTLDSDFTYYVERFFGKLFPMLQPKIYKNGGPIIAFQVENEYGSYYACDKMYLRWLKRIYDYHFGKDSVVLFTVDGYTDKELQCGTIPELYTTVDFGSDTDPEVAFKQQRKYQNSGPLVNSEYYTGWLDNWGQSHQTRDSDLVAKQLDVILSMNASVNMYMFHGGTNFGYMNGVDLSLNSTVLQITTTSYDYDAPLSEAGDTTCKYFKIQDVLKKYVKIPAGPIPQNTTKSESEILPAYPLFTFSNYIDRLYDLKKPVESYLPISMEGIGQGYGLAVYRTMIPGEYQNIRTNLTIDKVSDRAMIIIDGKIWSIHEDGGQVCAVNITLGKQLDIFVENQGRAADGTKGMRYLQQQAKGITGNVHIHTTNKIVALLHWSMYSVNDSMNYDGHMYTYPTTPVLRHHGEWDGTYTIVYYSLFDVLFPTDSYLLLTDFDKGQVYLNGVNIGRFWQSKAPQKTLFVPKNSIQVGGNVVEIISLSNLEPKIRRIQFIKKPMWN